MNQRMFALVAVNVAVCCACGTSAESSQPGAATGHTTTGGTTSVGTSSGTGTGTTTTGTLTQTTSSTSAGTGGSTGTSEPLVFAAVGDTRPPIPDDIWGYPSDIIQTIYNDIASRDPLPWYVVATGDYQSSDPWTGSSSSQFDLYLKAMKGFSGPVYPAMGNHECTGLTSSNCGP